MTQVVSATPNPRVGVEGRCALTHIHLGFRGFWLTSAIRQLFDLQVRSKFYLVRGSF